MSFLYSLLRFMKLKYSFKIEKWFHLLKKVKRGAWYKFYVSITSQMSTSPIAPLSQIDSLFLGLVLTCHVRIPGKDWPFLFHVINCSIPCHKLFYSMSYLHEISCRTCHILMKFRVIRVISSWYFVSYMCLSPYMVEMDWRELHANQGIRSSLLTCHSRPVAACV